MSVAPSEKHLENWIINNFHRFGDTWEADEYCWQMGDVYFNDDDTWILGYFDRIVANQFRLPCGIPDLIVCDNARIAAVEMKKDVITYDAVGQCLRYMHDLKEAFYWACCDVHRFDATDSESYIYDMRRDIVVSEYPEDEIVGVVVGHSLQDKNIPLVCAAAGVMVVTYEYENDEYVFTHQGIDRPPAKIYESLVNTKIGQCMRSIMQHRSARQKEKVQS